ncbi:MAG: methyltransferase domain-containing protein [Candidatus Hydrogenedentales bacterium]|jgi:SAM-dependent methyltransferase
MNGRDDLQRRTQQRYADLARCESSSRDKEAGKLEPIEQAKSNGYTEGELSCVPPGAIMGMGCGNPTAMADLRPAETVLDIGCGGGLDVFLAANAVGNNGRVIGIDPTPQMVERARENARHGDYPNVRFEQGEVEHLPIEDESVDVVISNCVLNHCLDKPAAFREIRRVLKPDGRMQIADLVTIGEFSQDAFEDPVWGAWLSVASGRQVYLDAIRKAGFTDIRVVSRGPFKMAEVDPRLAGKIESIQVAARP